MATGDPCPKCKKQQLEQGETLCPSCKSNLSSFWAKFTAAAAAGAAVVGTIVVTVALAILQGQNKKKV